MTKISTVIIAKNEADRIVQTIKSALAVTAEVIIVDTGSTDNTIDVSKAAGARVVTSDWLGYGQTKNYGSTLAQYEWILSLDADEVISPELAVALKDLQLSKAEVYLLNRLVNFEGQWIKYCGWHPDWIPRLFHRDHAKWNDAAVHEKLIANGREVKIDGFLHHYSYRSMQHFQDKIDTYAKLTAQQWISSGSKPSVLKRLCGPSWKYFQSYYLYKGYKDGPLGKKICQVMASGVQKKLDYFYEYRGSTS